MRFNIELFVLIETLKNIAGAQYHMMEKEKRVRFERFMHSFADFFKVVHMADVPHPLVKRASDSVGVLAITSDAGFMGGLNSAVIRTAVEAVGDIAPDKVRYVIIGDKGASQIGDREVSFKFFQGIANETKYEQAVEVRDYLVREVVEGRIGKLIVVYPRALSFTRQTIETISLLPCSELLDKGVEAEATGGMIGGRKVVVESKVDDMIAYLATVWLTAKLLEVFEDSKLAEFAARAMHLEGSVQKLQELNKKLKYQFFRSSHENVDKGMRESYSAKKVRDSTR